MKNKILILGSSGMAGHVVKMYLDYTNQFEIFDVARSVNHLKPSFNFDITDFNKLTQIIYSNSFDYIINCIGILNKISEENPDLAILVNSYLPHFLEKATRNSKTKIIHISTDCVFSGEKGSYIENDFKDGKGFYAQSKSLGEIINDKDLTIRTSIIGPEFNTNGVGLFNWIIKQNNVIYGYTNAYWSGITTIELAKSITKIILSNTFPTGLINLTNNHKISKYELLTIIKDVFNLQNITILKSNKYNVDKSLISTRNDLNLYIPTYLEMIIEMKEWIEKESIYYQIKN